VTGNTIGQWARWGYIRASQSQGDPHVYSVEDAAEAALVHELLAHGVPHAQVRRAIAHLPGTWPLSDANLAVSEDGRIVLDRRFVLSARGWQALTETGRLQDIRLRLRHGS
jgi:DNA-binding transcriptional MerR regulator